MSNYQSYSLYEPVPEQPAPDHIRSLGQTHRVTMTNGVNLEAELLQDRATSGDINPYRSTDHFGATARNPSGRPVVELRPDTLVTIDGLEASVAFFQSEGRITKAADGTYSETKADQAEPQADTSGYFPMRADDMEAVNGALREVEQTSVDGLASVATGVFSGRLDEGALVHKFGEVSGLDPAESRERVDVMKAAYQKQADAGCGVAPEDLPIFWAWAKERRGGALQEAVARQLHAHDVGGYRALAAEWTATTAPTVAALKAAGIPVRKVGSQTEAFVRGSWMSPGAAARAGLI